MVVGLARYLGVSAGPAGSGGVGDANTESSPWRRLLEGEHQALGGGVGRFWARGSRAVP